MVLMRAELLWEAVLVDPMGKAAFTFGGEFPFDLKSSFQEVLISLMLWEEQFSCSQEVHYLDNEAAKAGLIRGAGATNLANAIIGNFCKTEAELH